MSAGSNLGFDPTALIVDEVQDWRDHHPGEPFGMNTDEITKGMRLLIRGGDHHVHDHTFLVVDVVRDEETGDVRLDLEAIEDGAP